MRYLILLLGLTLLFYCSCKSDEEEPPTPTLPAASALKVRDMANAGNGTDLLYSFRVADESEVDHYRVMAVKASSASGFDVIAAQGVPDGAFQREAIGQGDIESTFEVNSTDTDGEVLANGESYCVTVLTVGKNGDFALSILTPPVDLAVTNLVITLTGSIQGGSGGMATDRSGFVYMADFGVSLSGPPGTKVFRITKTGQVSTFATGLVGASGNAFDSQGNLFQSNISASRISKITPDGTVTNFATTGVNGPVGIAIDPGDTLYVANCSDNTLSKITPDGIVTRFAASPLFNCPNGIARDPDGNLYVANFSDGNVLKVTPSGQVSVFANFPGGNNGHITYVNGVFYVIARTANQVYQLNLDGSVKLIAGNGTRGRDDGAALSASFSLPNDLSASVTGDTLYVNDVVPFSGQNISPCVIRMIILEE